MLTGEKTPIGSGFIRDVYLVEWEGRKLAVKFLREDYEERVSERQAERVHQFEAAALDAVSDKPFRWVLFRHLSVGGLVRKSCSLFCWPEHKERSSNSHFCMSY